MILLGGILSTENDIPKVDDRVATESVLPDTQEKNCKMLSKS